MPYTYGKRSKEKLATCHPALQRVFNEVINHVDCSILEGVRDKETQNRYFDEGKSKIQWPDGKHNINPDEGRLVSHAVDAVPYPVDWEDKEGFIRFGYFVIGVAAGMGIKLRWGGDWDRDFDLEDQRFNDYPHFELIE